MEISFDKSRELIQEATEHKKSDIIKAINLIEQAINISPQKIFSDYFKLADYLHIAGQYDKAYSVYTQLIATLNPEDLSISLILSLLTSVKFTEHSHKLFLKKETK
jgi:predicted TPR repeat methyltransferase